MKTPLWQPSAQRRLDTNLTKFIKLVNGKTGRKFSDYTELYNWSLSNIAEFWQLMWEFSGIISSRPAERVVENFVDMFNSEWFPGARLNFAENLLRFRDDKTALLFKGESDQPKRITFGQLYQLVARLSRALKADGVKVGDRVVGFMPNLIETVAAMLAASSIGAIWSSCSPDFGFQGVIDRFGQIKPKVLFAANGYSYNGKKFDSLERIKQIADAITTVEKVVIVPYTESNPDISEIRGSVMFADFLAKEENLEIEFIQLPFEHPLYIMYSSGTTGVPKCLVHGAGGTLIQHLKELIIHTDLSRGDTIFYFTTCGWMMWNWLISALAVGATLVLYDGNPFYPIPEALFELAESEKITIFGTSAKYLAALEQFGVKPREKYNLDALKTILSTGSPLSAESFQYVYRDIKSDLCLSSISGGTDIISCFALGNPNGAVYAGELQCRGLGMRVEAYNPEGKAVVGEKGELVCTAAFPAMPIYFWDDENEQKYLATYFERFPGIWHHGDYVEVTEKGGIIIYGRSDATLNPGGVRIGTAEIYRLVEAIPEIADSLVIGQDWKNDVRVVLFVRLADGYQLTEELKVQIKKSIGRNATTRHVPAKIISVTDIPYTISGKKVEIAVKRVLHGEDVPNLDALANPEALSQYRNLPELNE